MEFLFNETLMGLQDLDVPSGYGIPQNTINNDFQHTPNKSKSHSRQYSGTAILVLLTIIKICPLTVN